MVPVASATCSVVIPALAAAVRNATLPSSVPYPKSSVAFSAASRMSAFLSDEGSYASRKSSHASHFSFSVRGVGRLPASIAAAAAANCTSFGSAAAAAIIRSSIPVLKASICSCVHLLGSCSSSVAKPSSIAVFIACACALLIPPMSSK